jgi:alcohol dehydrogenase class IV
LPSVAIIDPTLTLSLPPVATASTGLDALTQLIEGFVSSRSSPLTDSFAIEGIQRAARSLPRAYAQGDDLVARENMAVASLLSGIVLANAGLGAVHGFAAPLGGRYHIPHGMACAAMLPHVIAANVRAFRAREPFSPVLSKFATVGRALACCPQLPEQEAIDAAISATAEFHREMAIPSLASFGVRPEDAPGIVTQAKAASSMKGNPIVLTTEELTEALLTAIA